MKEIFNEDINILRGQCSCRIVDDVCKKHKKTSYRLLRGNATVWSEMPQNGNLQDLRENLANILLFLYIKPSMISVLKKFLRKLFFSTVIIIHRFMILSPLIRMSLKTSINYSNSYNSCPEFTPFSTKKRSFLFLFFLAIYICLPSQLLNFERNLYFVNCSR